MSVYEVPGFGLFREMVDFYNISQIMKKSISNMYSMFRKMVAIDYLFLKFNPYSCLHSLRP
jgi:hypothetical protein